jgi:hypothetical protein
MTSILIRSGMVLALAGLVACGAGEEDSDSGSAAIGDRRPKVTDTEFATSMSGAHAMQPYSSIVDSTLSGAPCVETADGKEPVADKAVARSEVSLQQIASRSVLAADIGADATVKAGVAPGPNVEAGLHLLAHYDTSKSTLSFLLKSTKAIHESYPGEYRLTAAAQTLLRTDPKRFAKQCGRAFIGGMTRSATLYALVQVHVESEEVAAAAASNIGGTAKVGGVGDITANVSSSIAALRDKLGLKVTVDVLMDGFSTTLNVPTLDMSQTTPVSTTPAGSDPGPGDANAATLPAVPANVASTDKALASFSQQLKDMLNAAQTVQQEVIDGKGAAAPRLSNVSVVAYRTLATAAEDDTRFDAVDATLTDADDYLKDVLKVRNQIANVLEFEIEPFLRESQKASLGTGLVAYNRRALTGDKTVDTSKFMVDPDAMRRVASTWRDDFTGEDEETTGGLVEKLLDDCFTSAQNGDYRGCDAEKFAPKLATARAQIAKYAAEGRILPVVFSSRGPVTHGERSKQCGDGWHIASGKTEVVALSMVLPANTQDGAPKLAAWVDDSPKDCGGQGPLYSVTGTTGDFSCRDDGIIAFNAWKLPVLCVPRSGPFGFVSDVPGATADKF